MGFWHYCSPYASKVTMEKIVYVESRGNPYAIHDDTTGKSYFFDSKNKAIRIARRLLDEDHNIDMGLAQINSTNMYNFGYGVKDMFNPCLNIRIGSYILYTFYNKALPLFGGKALFRALEAYNSGSFFGDYDYAMKVWDALNR